MSGPELYEEYDHQQAVSLFGRSSDAEALCNGQWLVLPDAIVCLTVVGKPPRESHFYSASRFRWVADEPYHVAEDEWAFLSMDVRSSIK
jgi:hypothetical protein